MSAPMVPSLRVVQIMPAPPGLRVVVLYNASGTGEPFTLDFPVLGLALVRYNDDGCRGESVEALYLDDGSIKRTDTEFGRREVVLSPGQRAVIEQSDHGRYLTVESVAP